MRHYLFILLTLLTTSTIIHIMHIKKARQDYIKNYYNEELDHDKGKFINTQIYIRTLNKIRLQIKRINIEQKIHNSKLGPITDKTFLVVIQCQANVDHLKRLLNSLKKTFYINSALLIFSHDYYSDKMNKLIQNIDYAMYMQIFYPYSTQLHPEVFPGVEPVSCIEGAPCVKTRNAGAAQSKHHWWWQANQIFDHLNALKKFTKPILFLEANNYVIKDVLFIYKLLVYARKRHCPYCEMISLAAHDPEISQYRKKRSIVTIERWGSTIPRTAIAFDRTTWHKIKSSKEIFCFHNDSNWDNSLKHLGAVKMGGSIFLTAIDGPRVFSMEDCDVNDVGCRKQDKETAVKRLAKSVTKHMFPLSIKMRYTLDEDVITTEAGDWNDVRDHELCMRLANESVWYADQKFDD